MEDKNELALVGILDEIRKERVRQHAKWGEQNIPDGTGPNRLLFGRTETDLSYRQLRNEAIRTTDAATDLGILSYSDIMLEEVFEALFEKDQEPLRAELIQCAAVAVQWIQKIDREKAAQQKQAKQHE